MRYLFLVLMIGTISCSNSPNKEYKVIEDLPFNDAKDAKSYADLILKSIKTNRDFPIWQEFADQSSVNEDSLHLIVGMYSTGISGRDDWEYIDVFNDSASKDDGNGFNYAWLDPSGRLGIQIKIIPSRSARGFDLERIEFRSRLDVMQSKAFPGGAISDYVKLEYDWESKMKRMLEEDQK